MLVVLTLPLSILLYILRHIQADGMKTLPNASRTRLMHCVPGCLRRSVSQRCRITAPSFCRPACALARSVCAAGPGRNMARAPCAACRRSPSPQQGDGRGSCQQAFLVVQGLSISVLPFASTYALCFVETSPRGCYSPFRKEYGLLYFRLELWIPERVGTPQSHPALSHPHKNRGPMQRQG